MPSITTYVPSSKPTVIRLTIHDDYIHTDVSFRIPYSKPRAMCVCLQFCDINKFLQSSIQTFREHEIQPKKHFCIFVEHTLTVEQNKNFEVVHDLKKQLRSVAITES